MEKSYLKAVAGKFIGKKSDDALKLLNDMPEIVVLTLFSRDIDRLLKEVEERGLEVVAKIPLVGAIVVRGVKEKVLQVSSLDVVVAVDIPRVVRALGEGYDSGRETA